MTREEAIAIIRKEYLCVNRDCDIERSCGKCDLMMPSKEPILEAYKMAIQALEQEPCDDAISRNDMLDAVGHGTTYTSAEVQKIINGLPSVNPVPCEDAISRQAVIDAIDKWVKNMGVLIALPVSEVTPLFDNIHKLPPVNPQTGHWIKVPKLEKWKCSECGIKFRFTFKEHNYCPNCGAKMESEEISDTNLKMWEEIFKAERNDE